MKVLFPLLICCFSLAAAFGQTPFLPVGAKWVMYRYCSGSAYPSPPPFHYMKEVKEDSVIQGKYCTLIPGNYWPCTYEQIFVHQEGNRVYRYDMESDSFHLAIDFGKQIGENWKVKVCHDFFGTDTVTMTVIESDLDYRLIKLTGGYYGDGSFDYTVPIKEGFGSLFNDRLIISNSHLISSDPSCSDQIECYEDPNLGIIYGGWNLCFTPNSEEIPAPFDLSITPNPSTAASVLQYKLPVGVSGEVHIFNHLGARLEVLPNVVQGTGAIDLPQLPTGIYLVALISDGRALDTKKWVRM